MNSVQLLGRICADPELKTTQTGKSYCQFSLAVNRGKDSPADFIPCEAWNKTAEIIAKWFQKGSVFCFEGSLHSSQFTDKNGQNRYSLKAVVNNITFVPGQNNNSSDNNRNEPTAKSEDDSSNLDGSPFNDDEDYMPF